MGLGQSEAKAEGTKNSIHRNKIKARDNSRISLRIQENRRRAKENTAALS
jgi:hypothetical protein